MAARSWSKISHSFLRPAGRPGVSAVLEGRLWIGEYPTPDDLPWLQSAHGIEAVVSLQDDIDLAYKSIDRALLERAYREHDLPLHRFGVADGDPDDLLDSLDEILQALHGLLAAGRRVYLHCNGGFNRAPTVAIAYLCAHEGLALADAHDLVKACRPCAPYLTALRRYFHGS